MLLLNVVCFFAPLQRRVSCKLRARVAHNMPDIIVVLGHFDNTAHLTSTGRERLDAGVAQLHLRPDSLLAITGCAAGVPRTDEASAYLLARNVRRVELIDTHNTAEDAFLTEPLVSRYAPERLVVVTSDYHVERARFIFERVFTQLPIVMHSVPHTAMEDERRALLAHEERALQLLRTRGLYRP